MPELQGIKLIEEKVATLPTGPGVYRMLGGEGTVLYVGKAKNLKARVRSYARPTGHNNRILRMIEATRDMEFIRTETETDALLLEANLIKKLRPRYNILLRDDKSFPTFCWPMTMLCRNWSNIAARAAARLVLCPFASAGAVNRSLNTLQRAFLLRSCSDSVYESRTRPCLLFQIKRCSAPCTGEISHADYGELVGQAHDFLKGNSRAVQEQLVEKMETASARLDFEGAAAARDRIRALTYVQQESNVNLSDIGEADVIAIANQGGASCVQVFFFRAGQNLGNKLISRAMIATEAQLKFWKPLSGSFMTTDPHRRLFWSVKKCPAPRFWPTRCPYVRAARFPCTARNAATSRRLWIWPAKMRAKRWRAMSPKVIISAGCWKMSPKPSTLRPRHSASRYLTTAICREPTKSAA